MTSPQDHDAVLLAGGGTAAALIRNKERILERFCDRAQRNLPSARREPHPVIIDTLPPFITRVAMALRGLDGPGYATMHSNIALQHGNERARFTRYSLGELLKEYEFIREILADTLRAEAQATDSEWRILHRSIDEAMSEAAVSFVEVHETFRDAFTASLTHDFRGPLQTASNYLELLRREPDAALRDVIARRIADNLQRIARMIAALLDASRSNAGERLTLDASDFDIREFFDELVNDLDPQRRQKLQLDLAEDFEVHWDRDKIRRAVDNLIDNAFKYSTPGGTITVRVLQTHGRVHVSVHNHGEAISKEDRPMLFKPYRRTTRAQSSGKAGWGLGLVQVQAIAEAHGGDVGLDSEPASGTTFTLELLRDVRDLPAR